MTNMLLENPDGEPFDGLVAMKTCHTMRESQDKNYKRSQKVVMLFL